MVDEEKLYFVCVKNKNKYVLSQKCEISIGNKKCNNRLTKIERKKTTYILNELFHISITIFIIVYL